MLKYNPFTPRETDFHCRKFSDSYEREYHIDKFQGNLKQAIDYLVTNRNFSLSEANSFINQMKRY